MIKLIILLMLMGGMAFGQNAQVSPVAGLDQQNTSVVNNNFNQMQTQTNGIFGLFNKYFTNSILNTASGGTGKDSSNWTADNLIYTTSKGVWGNLGVGTTSPQQFLATQGVNLPPVWMAPTPAPGLTLKSTTTVSGADSGTISLTAGKAYKIIAKLQNSNNANDLTLMFNGDSGTNYWKIGDASASRANFLLDGTGHMQSAAESATTFDIIPSQATSNNVFVENAHCLYLNSAGGALVNTDFSGWYVGASAVTSFIISVSANTVAGKIWVYEYSGT